MKKKNTSPNSKINLMLFKAWTTSKLLSKGGGGTALRYVKEYES